MESRQTQILVDLLNMDFDFLSSYELSYPERNIFIENMLEYYQLHELNLTPIKSFKILKEVFHN